MQALMTSIDVIKAHRGGYNKPPGKASRHQIKKA